MFFEMDVVRDLSSIGNCHYWSSSLSLNGYWNSYKNWDAGQIIHPPLAVFIGGNLKASASAKNLIGFYSKSCDCISRVVGAVAGRFALNLTGVMQARAWRQGKPMCISKLFVTNMKCWGYRKFFAIASRLNVVLIPFPIQTRTRRRSADSAGARQATTTKCTFELELE